MTTMATGMFNTSHNPPALNRKSFANTFLRLFPNGSAPIFALTSVSGRSRAIQSTHGYFSKTLTFISLTLAAGVAVGDTDITIPATSGILKNMVLHNARTGENMRVTLDAANNATTIQVQRAFGRIAAAAMNAGDVLIGVGSAFEEGSLRPLPRRWTTVHIINYTQIFRNAWALTDTARASLSEAGYSNIQEDRKDCALMHGVDMEAAIIWGQASMDTTGPTPIHSTQGIIDAVKQYAPENVTTAGATTDYDQLVDMLEPLFKYSTDAGNPKERWGYGDGQAIKVLTQIGRHYGDIQMQMATSSYGMRFTKLQFYKGTINLIEHPLLNELGPRGQLLIVDHPALKLAYMDGRDTKPEEYNTGGKIVENGIDAVGGSLTTEFAVELVNPYSCGYIQNLTAGMQTPVLTQEV